MVAGGSGPRGSGSPGPDPFHDIEGLALRRAWWVSGAFFALVGVPIVILTVLEPPAVDQLPYFALNLALFFAFPAAYLVALRWGIRHTIRRLAPLRPLVREAAAPMFGPVLVLHSGIVMTLVGGAATFSRMYGSRGDPMNFGAAKAREWMRWSRLRRVAFIRSGRDGTQESSELRMLSERLGAFVSVLTISVPRASRPESAAPTLVVTLACQRMASSLKADRIVSAMPAIEQLIDRMARRHSSQGADL